MRAGRAHAGCAARAVGIRAKHLRPGEPALPVEFGRRGRRLDHFHREQVVAVEQRRETAAGHAVPGTLGPVYVREHSNGAACGDGLHHLDGRSIRSAVAVPAHAPIADGAEQRVDVGGAAVAVEDGEHMHAAVGGDFDAREQMQRSMVRVSLGREPVQRGFQLLHPVAGVVVGHRHAVDACPHEAEQPVLRFGLAAFGSIRRLAVVRRRRSVCVQIELPPAGAGECARLALWGRHLLQLVGGPAYGSNSERQGCSVRRGSSSASRRPTRRASRSARMLA